MYSRIDNMINKIAQTVFWPFGMFEETWNKWTFTEHLRQCTVLWLASKWNQYSDRKVDLCWESQPLPEWVQYEHRQDDESVRQCFEWSKQCQYLRDGWRLERCFRSRRLACSCQRPESFDSVFSYDPLHQCLPARIQHMYPVNWSLECNTIDFSNTHLVSNHRNQLATLRHFRLEMLEKRLWPESFR